MSKSRSIGKCLGLYSTCRYTVLDLPRQHARQDGQISHNSGGDDSIRVCRHLACLQAPSTTSCWLQTQNPNQVLQIENMSLDGGRASVTNTLGVQLKPDSSVSPSQERS